MKKSDTEKAQRFINEKGTNPFLASILAQRSIDIFSETELEDPFTLADMKIATKRIEQAVEQDQKIVVYGDYDCDGITSTVILYTYLLSIGANVEYYIPHRSNEGYGINLDAVSQLNSNGVNLIITVDNGISAIKEAQYIKQLGIDLIITDHHQPSNTYPEAVAIINPHRFDCASTFKPLAGVGVAFKLITALEGGDYNNTLDFFSDITAIGTIGDIVSMTGENRTIVNFGLDTIKHTQNIGLRALIKETGLNIEKITAQQVAFTIVPRLNVAGRMENASLAVDLLLCEDEERASELAKTLCSLNQSRKELEDEIFEQIKQQVKANPTKLANRVLVFWGENFSDGVIGIVCSRLVEKYSKPIVVISVGVDICRASARSFGDFSIFKAFEYCRDLLDEFGGHKLAGGLSIKKQNIEAFEQKINEFAKNNHPTMPPYELIIDKQLNAEEITVHNAQQLSKLEPFGSGNYSPLFLIKNAKILEIFSLSDDKHVRLKLEYQGQNIFILNFSVSSVLFPYKTGDIVDVVVNLDVNEYNGNVTTSLKLKDIRKSDFNQEKFFSAKAIYEQFVLNEKIEKKYLTAISPTREEVAYIYNYLKQNEGFRGDVELLFERFDTKRFNFCKLRLIIDMLAQMKIIDLDIAENKIKIIKNPEKASILETKIFQRINELS